MIEEQRAAAPPYAPCYFFAMIIASLREQRCGALAAGVRTAAAMR